MLVMSKIYFFLYTLRVIITATDDGIGLQSVKNGSENVVDDHFNKDGKLKNGKPGDVEQGDAEMLSKEMLQEDVVVGNNIGVEEPQQMGTKSGNVTLKIRSENDEKPDDEKQDGRNKITEFLVFHQTKLII
ncbi:hypothetical protein GVAV_001027 [Gurleya vavrai]